MINNIKISYPHCDQLGCHQIVSDSFYFKDNAPSKCIIINDPNIATCYIENRKKLTIDFLCIDSCSIIILVTPLDEGPVFLMHAPFRWHIVSMMYYLSTDLDSLYMFFYGHFDVSYCDGFMMYDLIFPSCMWHTLDSEMCIFPAFIFDDVSVDSTACFGFMSYFLSFYSR